MERRDTIEDRTDLLGKSARGRTHTVPDLLAPFAVRRSESVRTDSPEHEGHEAGRVPG